jgi:hypothetical protein
MADKLLKPRGPTRLKSRTLNSEINRNQTRNQEITRKISEFWNQKSLKLRYYWAQVLYDSGNSQKSGNRVRNQEIGLEITLEIKKSHYKSTEIRLESKEIRLEIKKSG